MGKITPEELWQRHTLERFEAFRQSGELEKLRKEGLATCGRKKRFTSLEWAKSPMRERYLSPCYMEWYRKCGTVAQKFGLATWTVVNVCLISGYQPDKAGLVVESKWPQIRVITESMDTQFLARLSFEAQLRGLHVIARQGSVETTQLFLNPVPIMDMEPPPMPSSMPPQASAFYMRVETPIGYPPQGRNKFEKAASQLEKDILTALGYSIQRRLRTSPLVAMADNLRVAKGQLASGEAYDIIDDIYGDDGEDSPLTENQKTEEQKKRKLVASRRHKLRRRLVKRYQPNK